MSILEQVEMYKSAKSDQNSLLNEKDKLKTNTIFGQCLRALFLIFFIISLFIYNINDMMMTSLQLNN